jgi:hypothetical protein
MQKGIPIGYKDKLRNIPEPKPEDTQHISDELINDNQYTDFHKIPKIINGNPTTNPPSYVAETTGSGYKLVSLDGKTVYENVKVHNIAEVFPNFDGVGRVYFARLGSDRMLIDDKGQRLHARDTKISYLKYKGNGKFEVQDGKDSRTGIPRTFDITTD